MKHHATSGLLLTLLLAGNAWPQGVITSFAGGPFLFTGNGHPAVNAPLGNIYGVTFDPSGNLVIADYNTCLVDRIGANGILSVIAGNYFCFAGVHTGDGGPAVNGALNSPTGIAYDSQGNLYIAELDRISQVSPQGIVNTIAGGGTDSISPYFGIAIDPTGAIYFSEFANNRVRKITPGGIVVAVAGTGVAGFSGDGGPA